MKTFLLLLLILSSCAFDVKESAKSKSVGVIYLNDSHTEHYYGPIIYLPGGLIKFRNVEGDTVIAGGTFWIESFH